MRLFIDNFDRISNVRETTSKKIFSYPRGHWFCYNRRNLSNSVNRFMLRVGSDVPVLVIYNIPNRDLGSHSAGGAKNDVEYIEFIRSLCFGLKNRKCIIIFEPDAIPHAAMSSPSMLRSRINLINHALKIIKTLCPNAETFVDVGHPRWISSKDISNILKRVYNFKGISINVSNFIPTSECIAYGESIGLPYVIDTSRNGNDSFDVDQDGWCNPKNRKLGRPPEIINDHLLKAYLWIKVPGESDGKCNGGPKAGKFWKDYAEKLL